MIIERKTLGTRTQERKNNSIPEKNDSSVEVDAIEETWEWDGQSWRKVS